MRTPLLAAVPALAIAVLSSAACGGVPWTVMRQAAPDPFVGHGQFTVERLHFEQTRIGGKTEAEYAADKQPEEQQSWQADKDAMSEQFASGLASEGEGVVTEVAQGGAIVRPTVSFIEPGFYAGVAAHPTEVDLDVQILDPQGNVQDVIGIRVVVGASLTNPASGSRLRQAAARLGEITAQYLKTRVAPEK
jgi:hypothetical protein